MSTNNRPAKIWIQSDDSVWAGPMWPTDIAYIRADIVERMAEALADISTNSHHPWSARIATVALTSYREASNDKA